ncbi:serpin-zx [Quercus suber]|uniref:Serpin-zx n=1 Tax=Quercus suber TaxID=58331 RepID=A0AAW0KZG6_QUESU
MTTPKDFHLLNGQTTIVPFMTSNPYEKHFYKSFDDFKILQIPYQCGQEPQKFSMYFFLPNAKDGLPNLIQMFISNPGFLNQHFELGLEETPELWIPRFKFSFEFEVSDIMIEMGLNLPFQPRELTEMVDSPIRHRLFLSKIFHKAYIEVNKEDTEAAASTVARFLLKCARHPTPRFVADHPFMKPEGASFEKTPK